MLMLIRRQRDVLALALRGQRLAALGPEAGAAVDDYPEETKAQQASRALTDSRPRVTYGTF